MVVAALVWEALLFRRVQVVFVESICRCTSLSLTGKLLSARGARRTVWLGNIGVQPQIPPKTLLMSSMSRESVPSSCWCELCDL